jgi:predicted nucleotidyltransferase
MKRPIGSKKEQMFDKLTSAQKIANVLYIFPDKDFTLTALSEESGVSKSTASELIRELEKSGFIKMEWIGKKTLLIRANRESSIFIKWKIVNNLTIIYDSGIVEFLNDHYRNPKAMALFGSFRWGQDGKDSDIDIAVEVVDDVGYDVHTFPALKEFEKMLNRKIQVHVFNRNRIDLNLFNNIANGIVLVGFLEVNK